jgi:hypothetical protein
MSRRLHLFAFALCSVGVMQCVVAQITPPQPISPIVTPINFNPAKPSIIGPAGVQATQSQTTAATLRWYQPVLTLSTTARDAAYFVVCLQSSSDPCIYGVSGTGVWSGSAAGAMFTRSPVYSGSPFTTGPRLAVGYNYSMTVTLDTTFYNRWLSMKVGACATTQNSSCTFANPIQTALSNVDLVAENTGSISNTMTQEHFYGQARNAGTGSSGAFIGVLELWQVVLTQYGAGYPWTCQTDPNASGLGLSDYDTLIDSNGVHHSVVSVRNASTGVIDTTGFTVRGIRIYLSPNYLERGSSVTLAAGTTAGIVARDLDITRPVGFVVQLRVDAANAVPEVDKTNNQRTDCLVVQ